MECFEQSDLSIHKFQKFLKLQPFESRYLGARVEAEISTVMMEATDMESRLVHFENIRCRRECPP